MSSPFAFLRSATARAHKNATKLADAMYDILEQKDKWQEVYDTQFHKECTFAVNEIQRMKIMKDYIQQEFTELLSFEDKPSKEDTGYFITIRPDDSKVSFDDFKDKIMKLLQRACFVEYDMSFEQAGKVVSDIGKGFHCHIVAKMKQRSKGEVLRDLERTFATWINDGLIASNCIDVCTTKNRKELTSKYLIQYVSDDDHKAATKDIDSLWREEQGLKALYSSKTLEECA